MDWRQLGIPLGLIFGTVVGLLSDNVGLGIPLGLLAGTTISAVFGKQGDDSED